MTLDTEPRDVPLPDELAEALRENDLLDAFNRLTPSDRRIALTWLTNAKKEETRNRRIELLVRRLVARKRK
ncbi:MAG: YdeI/OmpD-associated family protein [Blastocatellia bacterium]